MERVKFCTALIFLTLSQIAYGQEIPKGFSEQLNYATVSGGPVNDFKPALIIKAVVEKKPGSAGQQVWWHVKVLDHNYKKITFIKHINLTCGTTIDKRVIIHDVKNGESIYGGSVSGDFDLSDNIFKEDCDRPNRILSVSASDFGCELADDDPLVLQANAQTAKKKYADQLSGFRTKYLSLAGDVDKLNGVNKTKFEALRSRFRQLSSDIGNSLNASLFTKNDQDQVETNLSEIYKLLVDMDTEVDNLGVDAQAFKDKNKKNASAAAANGTTTTYVESEGARKMRMRAEAQYQKNSTEDDLADKASGVIAGLGALAAGSDESDYVDEDFPFVLRGVLATSYKFIPIIKNYGGKGFVPKSENGTTSPTSFYLGFDAKFFHDSFIGFNINPYYNYGVLALSSSTGYMNGYGADANIKIGNALQLILKGGYESREGKDNYDAVDIGIDGTTSASYKYYTMKYGVGLRYKFIEFSALKENITSQQGQGDNIPAYTYQINMESGFFGFKIGYSPNYPSLGYIQYPDNYDFGKKQDYIDFGLYWRISLFK